MKMIVMTTMMIIDHTGEQTDKQSDRMQKIVIQ